MVPESLLLLEAAGHKPIEEVKQQLTMKMAIRMIVPPDLLLLSEAQAVPATKYLNHRFYTEFQPDEESPGD